LEEAKPWYGKKLDFRAVHEWRIGDLQLAYMAAQNDDTFFLELSGDEQLRP